MKKKGAYFLLIIFITFGKISYSQHSSLAVYYSVSEKSRDSHSTIENFSLTGQVLAYSIKYTGKRGPGQKDETKICRLSNEQVGTINTIISKYKLNVTDSIIDNTTASQSISVITTIVITVTNGGQTTKIKVKGDNGAMEDKPLYSNAAYLFGTIRQMMETCHK